MPESPLARRELDDLAERLGLPLPPEARAGADLAVRARRGIPWPVDAPLLRTADGWVHPGPPTAWSAFVDMVTALGASWPDLATLTTDAIDAEAAAWMLPAAAVRTAPAAPDPVPEVDGAVDRRSVRRAARHRVGGAAGGPGARGAGRAGREGRAPPPSRPVPVA